MDIQKLLFETIRVQSGPRLCVGELVSQVLDINIDAAYRRLRGKTKLSPEEIGRLCLHFNISMDRVLHLCAAGAVFDYAPADPAQLDSYYAYIRDFSGKFERLAAARQKHVLTLAHDIPLYRLMDYPEMSFFKLYAWHQGLNGRVTYEAFTAGLDTARVMEYHTKVAQAMKQVASTEIWTGETINPAINLVDYFFDLNAFENKETPLLLYRQLLSVIDNLELWSQNGYIEFREQRVPFNLYGSPLKMCPNFSVVDSGGSKWGFMHLYGTQCMATSSPAFCGEIEKMLHGIMLKSLHINGASQRERHRIFQQQRNMVGALMQKIG